MNIHEYQAKQLFADYGIAVPDGNVAKSAEQAKSIANEMSGSRWVVKAQVHAGGRGKAGGVKLVDSIEEVKSFSAGLLGTKFTTIQTGSDGLPIDSVLVEKPYPILREFYLCLLLDRETERPLFLVSLAGGMDIEAVAKETPEQILTTSVHPAAGLQSYQCRQMGFALGLTGKQLGELEKIMRGMYQLFWDKDISQIEINPLAELDDGQLLALDAKINFDETALYAHPDIAELSDPNQEDKKENIAKQHSLNFISLDGNIGCMVNGAGLAMATMDLIKLKGGAPANFLDVGGGTTVEKVTHAFDLILSDDQIKSVLVNIFGGIVQCDIIAEGILQAAEGLHRQVPIVVRLEGTNAEQGRAMLNQSKLNIIAANTLEMAAEKAVELAN
ncbi:MAG: ADP-forming succinate--CoA ligase subunit beta [Methylococcaceae bacterium]